MKDRKKKQNGWPSLTRFSKKPVLSQAKPRDAVKNNDILPQNVQNDHCHKRKMAIRDRSRSSVLMSVERQ